jgi:ATP-dependent Lhr-like helicase
MPPLDPLIRWFESNGWTPFDFQLRTWQTYLAGGSGLVHAPTGSGKTLAVFGGPLAEALDQQPRAEAPGQRRWVERGDPVLRHGVARRARTAPFGVIWITPLRALANDTAQSLDAVARSIGLPWSVELRTSDTASSVRKKQLDRLPTVLVTTPESLSLLLSYPDARQRMSTLQCAIFDEWHELMSTKRGVQAELGLARLRAWNPRLRVWGLSATLGNLDEAAEVLIPSHFGKREIIHADLPKCLRIATLLPSSIERFPWAGHLGLKMVDAVLNELDKPGSALVFCNTRSHTEMWFKQIIQRRPEWLGEIAIHHGSLDRKIRQQVEDLLRAGRLRAVVCTSSLDLGVDFSAVDRVIQIGSPKGIGRLMQRAGRSGHRPGEGSVALCVPTHAFELVEFSAAREGIERREVESRPPLRKPLDVLVQHVVTTAAGGGFGERELLQEVRTTHAFADLSEQEWGWVMDFVARGGPTLTAYPRFARIRRQTDADGAESDRWVVASPQLARMHRLGIGTIVADGMVQLVSGTRKLGTIEESFIGRLRPGDSFVFAGRSLELISAHQMTARVRPAKKKRGAIPQWMGSRFPMSTHLAERVRHRLDEARRDRFADREMLAIAPLMRLQGHWSAVPAPDELLIESVATREGGHHFVFPFLGRLVHEGLGALLSHRVHCRHDQPVTATLTDYGIELHSPVLIPLSESDWRALLSPDRLIEDLLTCLNAGELTRRQFREIARIAGLIVVNQPGAPRSNRKLQASSEMFFDVFSEFDPGNLLLEQARREVLEQQLEITRLKISLDQLARQRLLLTSPARLTPMAFPLWAQRIASQTLRVENAQQRIERMLAGLEAAAADQDDRREHTDD